MLHEIAITPSVFKTVSYTSREVCDSEIRGIQRELLNRFIIRNSFGGGWFKQLWTNKIESPNEAQKLLKALRVKGRIKTFQAVSDSIPLDSMAWCNEALASHRINELSGILSCSAVKQEHREERLVCPIHGRDGANAWWNRILDEGSPRVRRTTEGYLQALGLYLKHASHIQFMDPHLDPTKRGYEDFRKIIEVIGNRSGPKPLIEIHRVCFDGISDRSIPSEEEWKQRFRDELSSVLTGSELNIEVFIWPDEHDRHFVTNLGGLHLGNSLKVNRNPNDVSTWSRLDNATVEDLTRKFDPAANPPKYRFKILGT